MPINPRLVHVYRLTDPVEARPDGAWVFQYHGESFLTGPDGVDPEPFAWADQTHDLLDVELKTREEIAGILRINPAKLALVAHTDSTFPKPILEFHDGPIWSADAIDAWAPTPTSTPSNARETRTH